VEDRLDSEAAFTRARAEMVHAQLKVRGIRDPRVLEAMSRIPRQWFLDSEQRGHAYDDAPVSIGHGQTLSQPYIVAFMTEMLELQGQERVLEIGTGSGYQTAVLAAIVREVYSIEVLEVLSQRARALLNRLGVLNVHFAVGDGNLGWKDAAPFDAILVAAAAVSVPESLPEQLADGGRMILPLGEDHQDLWIIRRTGQTTTSRRLLPVRFVPLIDGASTSSLGDP
jgi:protein-L-isoaspartate(D-aspartate) O-methyltransferase